MEILEFGDSGKRKMILIHGFQCPYQVWNKYIEHYKKEFHLIVPIMPGHNPSQKEDFISFSQISKELEDYMISHYGEQVYAVYGMSMGGVLGALLWQNRRLKVEKVIFDSSPLVSVNGMMKKMMVRFYLSITHKSQQRDEKTLQRAVKSICPPDNLNDFLRVLDNMSDTTIENCINDVANFRLRDSIDTRNTKLYFYHGTSANEMLAKKSAKYLAGNYTDSTIKCFHGKGHCENTLFHPEVMLEEIDGVLI